MSQRGWILTGAALVIAAFLGILVWASLQTGGAPGGMGINTEFGVAEIDRQPARDFSLALSSGGTATLSQFRGQVVLVDFWASWCAPCRQEAETLERTYREYASRGVVFLGVNIWDHPDSAAAYLTEFGVSYPTGIDADGIIAIDYGVKGIPEKFFVNRDGMLHRKFIGPMRPETLRQTLDELLADRPEER